MDNINIELAWRRMSPLGTPHDRTLLSEIHLPDLIYCTWPDRNDIIQAWHIPLSLAIAFILLCLMTWLTVSNESKAKEEKCHSDLYFDTIHYVDGCCFGTCLGGKIWSGMGQAETDVQGGSIFASSLLIPFFRSGVTMASFREGEPMPEGRGCCSSRSIFVN